MSNKPLLPWTLETLIAAKGLIPTHRQWCKGDFKSGSRYCLLGACNMAQWGRPMNVMPKPSVTNKLHSAIAHLFPARNTGFVSDFNDHPETKHADVMKVLDYAIKLAKGK